MNSPVGSPVRPGAWTSLWVVTLLSLLAQLWLCQFFSFGAQVPATSDVNPSNLWKMAYHFPPTGSFQVLNWLGQAYLPQPLNPFSLAAAHLPIWWFFTLYAPLVATLALLAMAAFLRELELPRPAALFGGVIYAWQGDILTFVFPGHYGYITTWPFFAVAAWGALRAQRTRHWAYAVMSGAGCGLMVGLQPDRGGIASLLIAALYAAPILKRAATPQSILQRLAPLRHLALCTATAALIALAPLLALFQSYIVGNKLGGGGNRAETYKFVTQFSIGPAETLTYLVPGFFGWHTDNNDGPYWGWVGEWPDWPKNHQGTPNFNLAISTTGTVATLLALIGIGLLLPGRLFGASELTERQRFYGRVLLAFGFVGLVLAWGWHTPLYRPLFHLPLMDKWRNPLKWLEMTNFALVTLSAFGMQHLLASLEAETPEVKIRRRRLSGFGWIMLVLLGLGLLASYPMAIVLASALQPEGYQAIAIANVMGTLHLSLLFAFALTALFQVLLYALWRPGWLRGWTLVNPFLHRRWQNMLKPECLPLTLTLGLAVLSVLQLAWVTTEFVRPIDLREMTATNPLVEALRAEGDRDRVSVATEDQLLQDLLENQFAADDISSVDISAASRIPDDLNTFFNGPLQDNQARIWFLAGVKNIAVPQQFVAQLRQNPGIAANVDHADGYTLEPTDPSGKLPSHALVGMRDYLAKATLVPRAEEFATDKALLKRLADPKWNPRESVLLNTNDPEWKPQVVPPPDNFQKYVPGPDKVELKTYTPTEIDIDVKSAKGGYVLINDQYDPDWQVRINGAKVPLLRADYIMRAIPVTAGDSTITMRYVARYHIGDIIRQTTHLNVGDIAPSAESVNNFSDGTMLAAWLLAGLVLWRRRT